MTKLVRTCALMTALAVFAGGTTTLVVAQEKKKAEKKEKAEGKVGTVEIYKAKDGYRFRIKNTDGKSMAISVRGLEKKEDVASLLEDIKETLNKAKVVDVKE